MRIFVVLVFALASVALALQAQAQTALIGAENTARPGGVYVSLNTPGVAACVQLCAQDNICMAWTYREAADHACELKAVVTPAVTEEGAVSGLSARAPGFAHQLAAAEAAPAAQPQTSATVPATIERRADASGLLGGPSPTGLRARLGE